MVLLFFIEYFEMKKKVFFDVQSYYRLLLWIQKVHFFVICQVEHLFIL